MMSFMLEPYDFKKNLVNHCRSGECHTYFFQCLYSKNSFQNGMFNTDQLLACRNVLVYANMVKVVHMKEALKRIKTKMVSTYAFQFK